MQLWPGNTFHYDESTSFCCENFFRKTFNKIECSLKIIETLGWIFEEKSVQLKRGTEMKKHLWVREKAEKSKSLN